MHLAHCPTLISMKPCKCWSRCSILPRIPSTSDRIFTAWLTRRCAASWMCPVTSLGVSSFAFFGDKDHEKICDCVTKVERHYRPRSRDGATAIFPYYRGNRGRNSRDFPRNPEQALSCFYCGKQGHFKRWCDTRKRDLARQGKDGASQPATK